MTDIQRSVNVITFTSGSRVHDDNRSMNSMFTHSYSGIQWRACQWYAL